MIAVFFQNGYRMIYHRATCIFATDFVTTGSCHWSIGTQHLCKTIENKESTTASYDVVPRLQPTDVLRMVQFPVFQLDRRTHGALPYIPLASLSTSKCRNHWESLSKLQTLSWCLANPCNNLQPCQVFLRSIVDSIDKPLRLGGILERASLETLRRTGHQQKPVVLSFGALQRHGQRRSR